MDVVNCHIIYLRGNNLVRMTDFLLHRQTFSKYLSFKRLVMMHVNSLHVIKCLNA